MHLPTLVADRFNLKLSLEYMKEWWERRGRPRT
jgi:hypothetical protein